MYERNAGYREIEHTADWELEVWAPDFPGFLEQAACGMYALAGIQMSQKACEIRTIAISALDNEELLVSFLSELLFILEAEKVAFDPMELVVHNNTLEATLTCAQVSEPKKEIKAVTYHNLEILEDDHGFRAKIVFDV